MNKQKARIFFYRNRVRFALFALIIVLIIARPTWLSIAVGAVVSLIGLAVRAWAAGHIRKDKALAVTGPYRFTRNPLYLGSLILGIGLVVGARSWWGAAVFAAYFLAFYIPVMIEERNRLRVLFPGPETEYERHVPAFFPTLRPAPATDSRKWDAAFFSKNKEYRAWIGTAVVWILFIVRGMIK